MSHVQYVILYAEQKAFKGTHRKAQAFLFCSGSGFFASFFVFIQRFGVQRIQRCGEGDKQI